MSEKQLTSQQKIVMDVIKAIGGQRATARVISPNFKYQSVQSWISKGRIPAQYVLLLAEKSGLSPESIRPDVFQKQKAQ